MPQGSPVFQNVVPTALPAGTPGAGYAVDANYVDPANLALQAAWAVMSGATGFQAPAFSATPVVDAAAGSLVAMAAMTAGITVGAPLNPQKGQRLTFIWLQDGTGTRAIAYNAVFKVSAFAATTTTANTRTIDTFVYDGTNWIGISRITGQN